MSVIVWPKHKLIRGIVVWNINMDENNTTYINSSGKNGITIA